MDNTSPVRFAEACGATAPLDLVIEKDTGEVVTRGVIDHPCAMIGRDSYCEIVLSDPAVSGRHAFLQVIGGRVLVVDLESRSGTRWADLPRPDGWLAPDVPVQVGPFRLHLAAQVSDSRTRFGPGYHPLQSGPLPDGYPKAAVEFRNGKVAQSRWEINRTVTLLGRARSCKINLASDEVSLFHAYFLLTPDGVWIVDLFGRGGVLVNGEPVRFCRLEHSDEVRVAKFVLGLAYEGGARPAKSPAVTATPLGIANPDLPTAFPDRLVVPPSEAPVTLVPAAAVPVDTTRFSAEQSQLFEQFQQVMLKMMTLFGQAHQQQIATLERELKKLATMTEELQRLQSQRSLEPPPATAATAQKPLSDPGQTPEPTAESARLHGFVFDRIAALHDERQGVWQRLLSLVSAKPANG